MSPYYVYCRHVCFCGVKTRQIYPLALLLCWKVLSDTFKGRSGCDPTWKATVLGLLVQSSLLRLLHVSLAPFSTRAACDNSARQHCSGALYITWQQVCYSVTVFLSLTFVFHLQLSLLLVIRLMLHQGSLPRFSNQDNPAAFHPCRHVRSVSRYFVYIPRSNCNILPAHFF
jgi:hypothetical protein